MWSPGRLVGRHPRWLPVRRARLSNAGAVRADEAEALAIRGVPFFVVDRTYCVSGAQPTDLLLHVLERAWAERSALVTVDDGAAGSCGPDGCAV